MSNVSDQSSLSGFESLAPVFPRSVFPEPPASFAFSAVAARGVSNVIASNASAQHKVYNEAREVFLDLCD